MQSFQHETRKGINRKQKETKLTKTGGKNSIVRVGAASL